MPQTVFERYGGFSKVSRIVAAFYDKVQDSPVLRPYFAGVDMRRLIDHQTKFIAQLMGGPVSYSVDALERAHAHLNIDPAAFEEMTALLTEALEDFAVEPDDVRSVMDEVRSLSRYVITRRSP